MLPDPDGPVLASELRQADVGADFRAMRNDNVLGVGRPIVMTAISDAEQMRHSAV